MFDRMIYKVMLHCNNKSILSTKLLQCNILTTLIRVCLKLTSKSYYVQNMPRKTVKSQRKDEAIRLRRLREKLGLTQAELAEKFRVVPSAVNHWESATRSIPGPVMVLIEIYEKNEV